jgi:hypothetical protein
MQSAQTPVNTATQLAPQDNQLMSQHRVLSFKPRLRLEWRGQDGQNETEQPDHSASSGDSITSSTPIGFSDSTCCSQCSPIASRPMPSAISMWDGADIEGHWIRRIGCYH